MVDLDISLIQKSLRYIYELNSTLKDFNYNYNSFVENSTCRNAVCMCLLQIGELTGKLSQELKNEQPNIEWHLIKGMRNIFAHAYSTLDCIAAWGAATKDVPKLKEVLQTLEKDFIKSEVKNWPSHEIYNFYSMRNTNLGKSLDSDPYKKNLKLLSSMLYTELPPEVAFNVIKNSPDFKNKKIYDEFLKKALPALSKKPKLATSIKNFNKVQDIER